MSSFVPPPWRTYLRLLLIGLAGIFVLATLPRLDGRMVIPPDAEGAGIRGVLHTADDLGATGYLPVMRRLCQSELDAALDEINHQRAHWWFRRDYRFARRLLTRAEAGALVLYRETRDRLLADREASAGISRLLAEELTRVRGLFRHANAESDIRRNLAEAELQYGTAQDLFRQERFAAAVVAGRRSLDALDRVKERSLALLARFDDPDLLARWKSWVDGAVQASRRKGLAVVVIKEHHRLDVYRGGKLVRSMPVDLGANAIHQKMREGDRATPEGQYQVTKKKGYGASIYGLALLINYPNAADRQRYREARQDGRLPAGASIGGLIEIHGRGGRGFDWTDGCVAPSDEEMRWLFQHVSVGTPVVIVGSDGTAGPIRTSIKENTDGDTRTSETRTP